MAVRWGKPHPAAFFIIKQTTKNIMRKKSAKKVAIDFVKKAEEIEKFIDPSNLTNLSEKHITWAHEYAIIRLYREFERMILHSLIAAINNNTSDLSQETGVSFPKHLKDEVCEYIIVGNKYFDFKGRDGLIRERWFGLIGQISGEFKV